MQIVWLPRARQNLTDIFSYVAKEAGVARAARLIDRITDAAEMLTAFPHLGKQSESDTDIRELQIPTLPYLLPYRVVGERVEILRVFHEAQRRPDQWR